MRLALLLALTVGVLGCGPGSHDVQVTIESSTSLSDAVLAQVRSLEIGAASGTHGASMTYPLSRALSRNERVTIHTTSDHGLLGVGVIAHDGGGAILAAGNDHVALDGTGPHQLTIALHPVSADGQIITLSPMEYTVFTGQSLAFTSDSDVLWSIQEGVAGGSIDASGNYTAPAASGTFHVVATSAAFFGHDVTATVQVLASGIAPYAGSLGGAGFADGPPGIGRLVRPNALVSDGTSIFFTTQDKLVRKLDIATGTLSTIAGALDLPAPIDGVGPLAHFGDPQQLAFDGSGNLYVADTVDHTIRKIVIATGQVTTLAGDPTMTGSLDGTGSAAKFSAPTGVAWDGAHTLFVSDNQACNIRKIDLTSAAVTTLAGTPSGMSPACGHVDGTGAAAHFLVPRSLAYDGQGTLFVEDNFILRKLVVATGAVSSTSIGISNMAWDGKGGLWGTSGTLVRVDVATGQVTHTQDPRAGFSGDFFFGAVTGTFTPAGTMYVATDAAIYTFDTTTNLLTLVAGARPYSDQLNYQSTKTGPLPATRLNYVNGLAVGPDGMIYTRTNDTWIRIDPTSGTSSPLPSSTMFNCCNSIAFDAGGTMYAVGYDHTIRSFATDSSDTTLIAGASQMPGFADGTGSVARFDGPYGMALDLAGGVAYVADTDNAVIRKVVLASGEVTTFVGTAGMIGAVDATGSAARLGHPRAIAYDGAGTLYFGDDGRIRKATVPGAVVTTLTGGNGVGGADGPPAMAQFYAADNMVLDAAKQNLFISDELNNNIRKLVLATNVVSTVAGTIGHSVDVVGAFPAMLNQPTQMVFSPRGELLVATQREQAILQIRLP
jgi:hypothetical protein